MRFAPERRDSIVTARRAGIRRHDPARQQPGSAQVAQHGVQRPLLERPGHVVVAREAPGDLISVEVLGRVAEHRKQHERGESRTQLALEFPGLEFRGPIVQGRLPILTER